MRPFEYFSPQSLGDACKFLAEHKSDSKILAGGTDVLIELRRSNGGTSSAIVDISRISSLRGITETSDSVVIGSLTTHAEVQRSQGIRMYAPLLSVAVSSIGSPQIRNRGTIGGNIINAAACADTVPPLIALGAEVKLKSSTAERVVPLSEFFIRPYVTAVRQDEILVEIQFPKLPANARSAFVKLGRRNALAIARLSVAAVVIKDDSGVVQEARIVPGAAFPKWQRVTDAENVLLGKVLSKELSAEAGKKVSEAMISITGRRWSTEYKEPVIAVLVRRALEVCM